MEEQKQSVLFVLQNHYEPVPSLDEAQHMIASISPKVYISSGRDDKRMNDRMETQTDNKPDWPNMTSYT